MTVKNSIINNCKVFYVSMCDVDINKKDKNNTDFNLILPRDISIFQSDYNQFINQYGRPTTEEQNTEYDERVLLWTFEGDEGNYIGELEVVVDTKTNKVSSFTYTHSHY